MGSFRLSVLYRGSLNRFSWLLERLCETVGHPEGGDYGMRYRPFGLFPFDISQDFVDRPQEGNFPTSIVWRMSWSPKVSKDLTGQGFIDATAQSDSQTRVQFYAEEDFRRSDKDTISEFLEELACDIIRRSRSDFSILDAPTGLPDDLVKLGFTVPDAAAEHTEPDTAPPWDETGDDSTEPLARGIPGRPRNTDDDWACREVWEKEREPRDVYPDWKEKIGNRYESLSDPNDSFRKAVSKARWEAIRNEGGRKAE